MSEQISFDQIPSVSNQPEQLPEPKTGKAQKRVHIETWGCQMNASDSEHMYALLRKENYEHTEQPEDADLIILNTCHIREKAYHKVLSRLGRLRPLKEQNSDLTIAVSGCVAQAEGQKLLQRSGEVDIVLGPGQIAQLPELVAKQKTSGESQKAIGFKPVKAPEQYEPLKTTNFDVNKNLVSRYVNIQQGCNNFCTFCVVPFTRGKERSHAPELIVERSRTLLAQGTREITLLGQNVNSYGLDLVDSGSIPASQRTPFVDLLEEVAQLPGLVSLRFTSSNPHDLTPELAELFGKYPTLGSYYHLPVQSGSNRILEIMRRKVTREEYLERLGWLRKAVPDMAVSTDLIVGFPGETDEDFEATLDLVRQAQFSFIFSFAYSKRKGTAAQRFKDQVAEETKKSPFGRA